MSSYELSNKVIVKHYAGSLAYGTALPTSDTDIRGIFCADPEEIRTPFYPVREVTLPNEEDGKLYELGNFMHLYTQGNPNILETLWVDNDDVISSNLAYYLLKEERENLLSSKVAFTFSGYAISQLKRIKGHNKWINNPQPVEKPRHADYLKLVQNFTSNKIMPRDLTVDLIRGHNIVHYGGNIFGVVLNSGVSAFTSDYDFNISAKQLDGQSSTEQPKYIIKYLPDEYRLAKEKHTNYWNWKNNRNETRSALEEDFGYDTKHAMHLIRLLRMGEEVLSGQGVIVKRPDASELLDIRAGKWTYDELIEYAEDKDDYIRGELYKNTHLPKKPNLKLAAEVVMECQDIYWSK